LQESTGSLETPRRWLPGKRPGADALNVAVLVALCILLWIPRLHGPIDLRYDAGVYYILGTSLAEGKGYRLLNEPGDIEAIQYPPLLPAVVAVHQWALGTSDASAVARALRYSYFLLFVLYVPAIYALARQYLASTYALSVALISVVYLQSIFLSDLLFAEIPFALASTLFVFLNRKNENPLPFLLTSALGVAAYLLRTAGIALLGAWVAESLVRKRWRQAALRTAVSLIPVIAWQAYVSRVTSSEEYRHPAYAYQRASYLYYNVSYAENIFRLADPFAPERGRASLAHLASRLCANVAAMPASLGEGITRGEPLCKALVQLADRKLPLPAWVAEVPNMILGSLIVAGLGCLLARREWFVPLYLIASIVLTCLTPWPGQFARYLTPLTPLLALCLVQFLVRLTDYSRRRCNRKWRKLGSVFTWFVLVGVLSMEITTDLHGYLFRRHKAFAPAGQDNGQLFYYDRAWFDFDAALEWLKTESHANDITVATSAPQWTYLKTGLKAVMPPMEADPTEAQRLLDSVPVGYVIVDELEFLDVTRRYAEPVIKRHPEQWQLVYVAPESATRIYSRVGAAFPETDRGPIPVSRVKNVSVPRGTK
jgi:hypothetical protein